MTKEGFSFNLVPLIPYSGGGPRPKLKQVLGLAIATTSRRIAGFGGGKAYPLRVLAHCGLNTCCFTMSQMPRQDVAHLLLHGIPSFCVLLLPGQFSSLPDLGSHTVLKAVAQMRMKGYTWGMFSPPSAKHTLQVALLPFAYSSS